MAAPPPLAYGEPFYAYQKQGSIASANAVVPFVVDLVKPTSIVDVGCGVGSWLAAAARAGITEVLGIDGDHVPRAELMIPTTRFRAMDISQPFTCPERFDLAMSLEVAEHLPTDSAALFVQSLTTLAPVVLFSAAIPHQGGWNHVNEQWPEYWAELFEASKFLAVDCLRERFWNEPDVRWWYAQNMMLYVAADHPLWRTLRRTARPLRALVHPQNYLIHIGELREAAKRRTAKEIFMRLAAATARRSRRLIERAVPTRFQHPTRRLRTKDTPVPRPTIPAK